MGRYLAWWHSRYTRFRGKGGFTKETFRCMHSLGPVPCHNWKCNFILTVALLVYTYPEWILLWKRLTALRFSAYRRHFENGTFRKCFSKWILNNALYSFVTERTRFQFFYKTDVKFSVYLQRIIMDLCILKLICKMIVQHNLLFTWIRFKYLIILSPSKAFQGK